MLEPATGLQEISQCPEKALTKGLLLVESAKETQ